MRLRNVIGVAAALLATTATAASAHVGFTPETAHAGHATLVTLTVPHDCNGKGTTSLEMQVPEEVLAFTPVEAYGWKIDTTTSKLEESADHDTMMHAGSTGEHVDSVTWTRTGEPVPHGEGAAMQALVALSEDVKAGDMVHFPTIQGCPDGEETKWNEVPEKKNGSMDDLEHPAPMLMAATGDMPAGSHTMADGTTMADEEMTPGTGMGNAAMHAKVTGDIDEAGDMAEMAKTLAIIALIVSVIALLVGIMKGRGKKE